ncbi:MAG TPA: alpha/beta hydrolase [Gemmatales bacterium]|nr:alpha/beta hydrolase [Gemmatales bacterium]
MIQKANGHYAPINGLQLYYEVYGPTGAGTPLILLHGGVGSIEMFHPSLPILSQGRQVVAVDLQGHGRTADIVRPLQYELMGDDIAALIKHLKFEQADIMGYSLGGGVGLRTAIQHPLMVRKLIVVSAPFKRNGWYPEILKTSRQMKTDVAESMKKMPHYSIYAKIAPRPQDWPILISKLGELISHDYDWCVEAAALKQPVMIVVGDADAVRTSHTVECFELLGGGKQDAGWEGLKRPISHLAIMPGINHYNIVFTPALATMVTPFLDAPMPRK